MLDPTPSPKSKVSDKTKNTLPDDATLIICAATVADAAAIAEIHNTAFEVATEPDGCTQSYVETMLSCNDPSSEESTVIELDFPSAPPKVIGFAQWKTYEICKKLQMKWNNNIFALDTLAVLPDCSGCGVGTELVQRGKDTAEEMGLHLMVEPAPDAVGFYEKTGFEETDPLEAMGVLLSIFRCQLACGADIEGAYGFG